MQNPFKYRLHIDKGLSAIAFVEQTLSNMSGIADPLGESVDEVAKSKQTSLRVSSGVVPHRLFG